MKNKSIMRKVIIGIVAASLAVSVSVAAMAQSTSSGTGTSASTTQKAKNGFGSRKAPGVYASSKLTKAQLDSLVKAGTITQDQENKIEAYIKQKNEANKAERDKIKSMTEAERKAYFEANKGKQKTDLLTDLVSQNIISQTQADAIKKAIPVPKKKEDPQRKNNFKTQLDSLVKAGTITQDQENKIQDYIKQKNAAKKAEMDKIKNMTAAERKAYFEANKGKRKTDLFSELVSQNIISQTQADAIKKAIPAPKGFKHNGRKPGASQGQTQTQPQNSVTTE